MFDHKYELNQYIKLIVAWAVLPTVLFAVPHTWINATQLDKLQREIDVSSSHLTRCSFYFKQR